MKEIENSNLSEEIKEIESNNSNKGTEKIENNSSNDGTDKIMSLLLILFLYVAIIVCFVNSFYVSSQYRKLMLKQEDKITEEEITEKDESSTKGE